MKNNNLLKYLLIIIVIVIISLALFYLYNYITTNNEPFVSLTGIIDDINTITGEPKINDDKTVNLIVDNIRNIIDEFNSVLQLLCSNNKGFYGIKNNGDINIYYYNPENNETTTFEKLGFNLELPTNSDGSKIVNPDYKNRIPICGGLLLNVSNKALWYYNDNLNDMENINIDGLYYSTLDEDGKPILNNNKVVLKCLRLPLLSNLPLTTQPGDKPHAPYDTIKYMAINDDVLFAVGCYETTQVIYYCKLTDGIPETNDASNWKTTQIGNVMVENIKDIFINDNYLFIISLTNDNNYKPIYKIHYNKIEFDSNNILISDFKELSLLSSYTSPKFYFNNNILYIYDIDFSSRQINLKYIDITDLTQTLTIKKITFSNEEYTLPDNLMKYQNLLITSNNAKYSILELYDDTHTTTNTTSIINDIRKMFNPNYDPTATTSSSGAGTSSPSSTSGAGTTSPSSTSGAGTGTGAGTGSTSSSSSSGSGTGTGSTSSSSSSGSGTGTGTGTTTSGSGTTTSGSGTGSGTGSTTSGTGTGAGAGTGTTTSGSSSGSGTGTKTSGTALPSPTETPSGNQSPGSFVFGSAWRTGSLLNNELDNIANTDDGIPINDINFEELSGVNMLINGKGNTGNFNDFIAKNRVFGNNLFFINKN